MKITSDDELKTMLIAQPRQLLKLYVTIENDDAADMDEMTERKKKRLDVTYLFLIRTHFTRLNYIVIKLILI